MRFVSNLLLLALLVIGACEIGPRTAELAWVEAPADGGLRLSFDHPCPEGGALDIHVEETDDTVTITGFFTGKPVIDCVGDWTAVSLSEPLGERRVVDGSDGEQVEIRRR